MPRILVADDNSNIQKMVALALEERGIDVVSVGNGEAAVRRIPDLAPDLVLADVFMPVRNGYEVCEFVKKNERFSHVPVILLVGAFDPLDEKEARRVGADGVLKKPFVPPDPLIAMVTSALEKNPRIAAETEKSRETPAPAPPVRHKPEVPPVALEPPAHTHPKPLPKFPDPSPEEDEIVYGFEKRGDKSDDERDSRPRFPRKGKEPQSLEDFDHAVTASDWRRSAADFEIPDDLNGQSISPDEGFSAVVFPSENGAPPKHVPFSSAELKDEKEAPAPPLSSVPGFSTVEDEAPSRPIHSTNSIGFSAPTESAQSVVPAPTAAPPAETGASQQSFSVPAKGEEPGSSDEDGLPSPSEYADDSWMSGLLGKFHRGKSSKHDAADSTHSNATHASPEAPSASEPVNHAPAPVYAAPESVAATSQSIESSAPAASSEHQADDGGGSFFAQETHEQASTASHDAPSDEASHPAPVDESPAPAGGDSWFAPHAPDFDDASNHNAASAFSAETDSGLLASPADSNAEERAKYSDTSSPSVEAKTSPDLEIDSASEYESQSAYGQASPYEQAPIVDERDDIREHAPSSAGRNGKSSSAPAEFPAASSDQPANHKSPNGATQDKLGSIFAPLPEAIEASETPATFADSVTEFSERIPTAPPPNREALAEIPFLTPPPPAPFEPPSSEPTSSEPEAHTSESAAGSSDSANADSSEPPSVDAVVKRLLEKLQPQLNDMLAKDVLKPLVKNLLDQETPKKSK
ncbi:MAG TPA: response regulator [Candidatus Acidoferrales bacterium]|nr:response regulator [Candidatus Acidoferrales bacterium]